MEHEQVGKFEWLEVLQWDLKFKSVGLAYSAVLEHGQVGRGCRFATSCSDQICFAIKTCSWNPMQIGVAGQPLANELEWLVLHSLEVLELWQLRRPAKFVLQRRLAVLDFGRFAMLQLCQVTDLLGQ